VHPEGSRVWAAEPERKFRFESVLATDPSSVSLATVRDAG